MSLGISSSVYPTASLAAIFAIGNPVAFDASADERETRGFISITRISPLSGLQMPRGGFATSWAEAEAIVKGTDYPAIIRPSFTLGGTGGGTAFNPEEFEEIVRQGLLASPIHEVLIEESILGWKEFELEVMRDLADNVVIICSIENFDPMGVHTGDSITVAP